MTPHHSPRAQGVAVDLVVEHYTAGTGTAASTAAYMRRAGNSAHAEIGRGVDDIVEPVAIDRAAWHAGDHNRAYTRGSRFPSPEQLRQLVSGARDIIPIGEVPYVKGLMNARSVGCEYVNLGWAYADKPDAFKGRHRNPASRDDDWQPYTYAQMDTAAAWHRRICHALPSLKFVCGHEDVCHADTLGDDWRTPGLERKTGGKLDPGPAFLWERLPLLELGLVRVVYDFARHGWRLA